MPRIVTLGEVMLRLKTPGFERFRQAASLEPTFGGGEANVAASLSLFGHQASFVSAIPANPVGDWCLATLNSLGVDTSKVVRQGDRLGIYFLESGASQRASNVVYDRAGSAIAELQPEAVDWSAVFADVDWFHFTGITPALSATSPALTMAACQAAKAAGCTISCDLNYRKKLWTPQQAGEVMATLMPFVDVAIGNEEDAEKVFGISAEGADVAAGQLDHARYRSVAEQLVQRFPNLREVAITLRESHSASHNGWSAMLWSQGMAEFSKRYELTIVDRVGAGDSFAAGLIHALVSGQSGLAAVEFAAAASCLKHSIPGDINLVTVDEVERLVGGDGSGRVQR